MAERLQKFLSKAGVASRRHAEELIAEGRVKVNGEVVSEPGTKVEPGKDLVQVDGKLVEASEERGYFILYKPEGVVTTLGDPEGRPTVADFMKGVGRRVYPVGRLDYDAEGALLLTDDGELAHRLMHPSFGVPRTYLAKVRGTPDEATLEKLRGGVRLEDGMAKPLSVDVFEQAEKNTWIKLVLGEGRTHLVKRLCAAVGHPVVRLFRPHHAGIGLEGLQPGEIRPLTAAEVESLRAVAEGRAPGVEPAIRLPARRHGRAEEEGGERRPPRGEGAVRGEGGQRPPRRFGGGRERPRFEDRGPRGERGFGEGEEGLEGGGESGRGEVAPGAEGGGEREGRPPRRFGGERGGGRSRFGGGERPGGPSRRFGGQRGEGGGRPRFGAEGGGERGERPPRRFGGQRGEGGGRPRFGAEGGGERGEHPPRRFGGQRGEGGGRPRFGAEGGGERGERPPRRFGGQRGEGGGRPRFGAEGGSERPPRRFGGGRGFGGERGEGSDRPRFGGERQGGDRPRFGGRGTFGTERGETRGPRRFGGERGEGGDRPRFGGRKPGPRGAGRPFDRRGPRGGGGPRKGPPRGRS